MLLDGEVFGHEDALGVNLRMHLDDTEIRIEDIEVVAIAGQDLALEGCNGSTARAAPKSNLVRAERLRLFDGTGDVLNANAQGCDIHMLVRALFDVAEELRVIPAALRHGSALGFFNQVATRRIDKIGIHRIKRPRRTYEVDPVVIGVDALTAQDALIDIPATLGTTRALALVHLIGTEAVHGYGRFGQYYQSGHDGPGRIATSEPGDGGWNAPDMISLSS